MTSEEYLQLRALMQQNQEHLLKNQQHLERLVQHADRDRWYISFGSDVAANLFTDGLVWIARRLMRNLRFMPLPLTVGLSLYILTT